MKARLLLASVAATALLAISGALSAQDYGAQGMSGQGASNSAAMSPSSLNENDIRQIQQALRDNGHTVTIDGRWGAETASALQRFQQDHGLGATGQPDPRTFAALKVTPSTMSGGSGNQPPASGSPSRSYNPTSPSANPNPNSNPSDNSNPSANPNSSGR